MSPPGLRGPFLTVLISLAAMLVYALAYAVKRNLADPQESAFRDSLWLIALVLPLATAFVAVLYKRRILTSDGVVAVLAIFTLSSLCFALTIPAILDRSVSLYLLNSLDNRAELGMSEAEVEREFLDVYFDGNYAIRKRLHEQLAIRTVHYSDGRYYITDAGSGFMTFARFMSRLYNLDPDIVQDK